MTKKTTRNKKLKQGCIIVTALFVFTAITVLIMFAHSRLLAVTTYDYSADKGKVHTPFKIAFLADHHGTSWGENQEELLTKLREGEPDIILLGGDIFCSVLTTPELREQSRLLIAGAVEIAPTYFVEGNHEQANPESSRIRAEVRDLGATVLQNEFVELDVLGNRVILAGSNELWLLSNRAESADEIRNSDALTILLSHFPERAENYAHYEFDLIFAGHAHGGQARIPLFAPEGLYAPGQGRFPSRTGGKYELDSANGGGTLIVTRGLSLVSSGAFRFNNRPEVVFVEVA